MRVRELTLEQVKETFENGYDGPDIYVLLNDGTDVLIHENGYELNWCEEKYRNGCRFYKD